MVLFNVGYISDYTIETILDYPINITQAEQENDDKIAIPKSCR